MLRIVELDRGEAKSSIWQRGIVGHRRYPTVRLGAPAKLKNLHSKIGRRVDFARVRYGTMQSERRRMLSNTPSNVDRRYARFTLHAPDPRDRRKRGGNVSTGDSSPPFLPIVTGVAVYLSPLHILEHPRPAELSYDGVWLQI